VLSLLGQVEWRYSCCGSGGATGGLGSGRAPGDLAWGANWRPVRNWQVNLVLYPRLSTFQRRTWLQLSVDSLVCIFAKERWKASVNLGIKTEARARVQDSTLEQNELCTVEAVGSPPNRLLGTDYRQKWSGPLKWGSYFSLALRNRWHRNCKLQSKIKMCCCKYADS
jgi:hypothetical protein